MSSLLNAHNRPPIVRVGSSWPRFGGLDRSCDPPRFCRDCTRRPHRTTSGRHFEMGWFRVTAKVYVSPSCSTRSRRAMPLSHFHSAGDFSLGDSRCALGFTGANSPPRSPCKTIAGCPWGVFLFCARHSRPLPRSGTLRKPENALICTRTRRDRGEFGSRRGSSWPTTHVSAGQTQITGPMLESLRHCRGALVLPSRIARHRPNGPELLKQIAAVVVVKS